MSATFAVKTACRLVKEYDFRVDGKSAGNCHTLLLTTAQFVGVVFQAVAYAKFGGKSHHSIFEFAFLLFVKDKRKGDVFISIEVRHKVVILIDKSHVVTAQ